VEPAGDIIEGPDAVRKHSLLDTCLQTEASILERMGRLAEALIKDSQLSCVFVQASLRITLGMVAEGRLEAARDMLRRNLAHPRTDAEERRTIEGPDQVLRAKELLCQVLHSLGGEDPRDAAELTALRAELRQEEARRGEALREVRALIRTVAGEQAGEEAAEDVEDWAVAVAPKTSKKKKNKKGKRGQRSRAAATTAGAAQNKEEEEAHDGAATEEAAAVAPLPAAESECDVVAPPRVDEGLEAGEEEGAADKDDCPVCLQPLGAEGGEEEGVLIMCGHEYHETCLDAWVSTCVRKRLDVTCPSCRAPVSR
jgi:hypothetical protein